MKEYYNSDELDNFVEFTGRNYSKKVETEYFAEFISCYMDPKYSEDKADWGTPNTLGLVEEILHGE